jgi:hypothetical protein
MATFKVGQRVRIKCPGSYWDERTGVIWDICPGRWTSSDSDHVGKIAYSIDIDEHGRWSLSGDDYIAFPASDLVPLTDPKADAMEESRPFRESLKKLGREPNNVTTKEKA